MSDPQGLLDDADRQLLRELRDAMARRIESDAMRWWEVVEYLTRKHEDDGDRSEEPERES